MNENLIKGLVKLKLGMMDNVIDHLPEEEAAEVRKLGNTILEAVTEYRDNPVRKDRESSSSKELKSINID
ncbi:hypothetical protein [Anoxynatronum buryatiense]|uniref:Uncharacterized protein n=1 Tax=Anoxynatronum buryatiense TaxID=489973 RepID=A0AA45WX90_9CLOT|nr:hypothetical protein [Anoxynatronum buryatiense]SMP63397.1 hypothetical protein SAMN06296020_11110 [Anoxynatronum buryatiense]